MFSDSFPLVLYKLRKHEINIIWPSYIGLYSVCRANEPHKHPYTRAHTSAQTNWNEKFSFCAQEHIFNGLPLHYQLKKHWKRNKTGILFWGSYSWKCVSKTCKFAEETYIALKNYPTHLLIITVLLHFVLYCTSWIGCSYLYFTNGIKSHQY